VSVLDSAFCFQSPVLVCCRLAAIFFFFRPLADCCCVVGCFVLLLNVFSLSRTHRLGLRFRVTAARRFVSRRKKEDQW